MEIEILKSKRYTNTEIAKVLNKDKTSIGREIKRNKINGIYDSKKANHKAYVKRKYSKYDSMKILENMKLRELIEKQLKEGYSPEQISGRIALDQGLKLISKTSIYKYISSEYGKLLRLPKKKSRNKRGVKVYQLENRIWIDERPKEVNRRENYGDWEGDFIVSGKSGSGVLLVLHERKSRYVFIRKIDQITLEKVHQTLKEMSLPLSHFNSLTLDNDIAFRRHILLKEELNADIYFCHPYHSWEKGGVEYSNRLIRRFVPKGCDISKYTHEEISRIQDWMNRLPRKCILYKKPEEVMIENGQLIESYISVRSAA